MKSSFYPLTIIAAATLLLTSGVHAQTPETPYPTNLFEPAPGPSNFMAVESPEVGSDMKPSIGAIFSYQHRPFVILACTEDNNCGDDVAISSEQGTIDTLKSVMVADVMGSFTFLRRFQVGLAVPLYIWQTGRNSHLVTDGATGNQWLLADDIYNSYGVLGDIRIHLKGRILGKEGADGFMLSAAIIPTLPMTSWTGQGNGFTGASFLTVTAPQAIAGYRLGNLRLAANLGFLWREKQQFYSAEIGHSIKYSVAGGYNFDIKPGVFRIEPFAEIYGMKAVVSNNFNDLESAPLLFTGGGRFSIKDFTIIAAVGGGIISGVGVPQIQGMLGVNWAPTKKKNDFSSMVSEWDLDGDGIDNDVDECPNEPEDFDSFQDEDGCPDPDNDGDGIPDGYDSCPNEPEDFDGFRDDDGCPDLDHDEDGIKEPADKCPEQAEDYDGFEDEDGCPDPDNDGDGILDVDDMCPNLAEDFDGFEDEDGCPDYDNDNDGVPDTMDKCPNEAETLNGIDDDDGCPDRKPAMVIIEETRFVQKVKVEFKGKSSDIKGEESFAVLDIIGKVLIGNPALRMSIESHTDSRGTVEENRELTRQRSETIKAYMIKLGVEQERLETVAWGDEQPLESNARNAGRTINNRVDFVIIRPVRKVAASADEDTMEFEEGETMDFTEGGESGEAGEEMDFTIEEDEVGADDDADMDFSEDEIE